MKKLNRLIGTAAAVAALLLTVAACSNSFTPQASGQQQSQNGGGSYSQEALATPLTLEACDAGAVVTFVNKAAGPVTYKVNGGEAQTIASGATGKITLESIKDKVEFFGANKAYATNTSNCSNISCDKDCYVYGNIMSLVKSEGFENATTLENAYTFARLFADNAHIKNKSGADLLLPATTLASNCYQEMFSGCTSLTAAPDLPATTLAEICYHGMFYGCTSLTAAPELKATTLARVCYGGMFSGCASLATAPSLPATKLAENCYSDMFSDCANLTAAPELKATTLANYCYQYMFSGCTSLASVTCLATNISASSCTTNWLKDVAASGTFTKADGMTGWTTGASGIPNGWTVRDFSYSVPPTLEAAEAGAVVTFSNKAAGPVTYKVNGGEAQTIASGATGTITLEKVGDKVEFFGDNNTYATIDFTHYSHIACSADCYIYGNIMSLVKSVGFASETTLKGAYTFCQLFDGDAHIKNKTGSNLLLPATTLADGCYSEMFRGCTGLTSVPSLPATTLAWFCYSEMFYGCASLTAAPSLPATTLAYACYSEMFYGCTSLTAAPELPATTLPAAFNTGCYEGMFAGCSNLTTAPALPAAMLTESCYENMFSGCSKLSSVTCLATDISASDCTLGWLKNVAASGTFIKADGMTGWPRGENGIPSGWTYNEEAPLAIPLTLEAAVANAVVTFSNKATGPVTYKMNGGTKQEIASGATGTITLANIGDKVEFFGDNNKYAENLGDYSNIACSADCYVYGNIMSLVQSEGFKDATELKQSHTFCSLFKSNTHIKNKSGAHLLLPATTLTESCYSWMFYGCASLTAAPSLPATSLALAKWCYEHMFYGCASLTKAPELPATTLGQSCYMGMFSDCTSLTDAPSLPAPTLAISCYMGMFSGCTSLTDAPSLPATTLAEFCYSNMFSGCASLASVTCLATNISATVCTTDWLNGVAATAGTFTKAAGADWSGKIGADGIPSGWTVVDKQ
ncbi:MAG: leucine-rich repeat protein [Treponema sp.]|nr:leucine-rich repeat protein [Treponema sp.]